MASPEHPDFNTKMAELVGTLTGGKVANPEAVSNDEIVLAVEEYFGELLDEELDKIKYSQQPNLE